MKNAELNDEDENEKPRGRESKKGPGDLVSRPIFQEIQNKLLKDMIGKIKV